MKNNGLSRRHSMFEEFHLAEKWINKAFNEGVFSYEEPISYSSARSIASCAERNDLLLGISKDEAICILCYSSGYLQGRLDTEGEEDE